MEDKKSYHRFEIAKLIISVAVPTVIGISGFFVQRSISDFQSRQMTSREITIKLADRRLATYDLIKGALNQIYCYIEEIGDWDKVSAEEIKDIRNKLNRIMYSDRAVWSPETFRLYSEYIDEVAFQINVEGGDSLIRAEMNPLRLRTEKWHRESAVLLTGIKAKEHRFLYRQLNDSLSTDLMLSEMSSR